MYIVSGSSPVAMPEHAVHEQPCCVPNATKRIELTQSGDRCTDVCGFASITARQQHNSAAGTQSLELSVAVARQRRAARSQRDYPCPLLREPPACQKPEATRATSDQVCRTCDVRRHLALRWRRQA